MTKMEHILIVEDDVSINQLLKEALEKEGYLCTQAFSGTEALLAAEHKKFSLMLLDLMLPGMPGEEVLGHLREISDMPVIILTAKDTLNSKVDMLLSGADDYVTKPFDIKEVTARIVAALRRGMKDTKETLTYKNLKMNRKTYQVFVGDQEIKLTRQEFKILECMLKNQGRVFSKQELYDYAWDEPFIGEDKAISVHISNIRKKIKVLTDEEYIETVWGIGFKLC